LPPGSSLSTAGSLVLAFGTDGIFTFTINATDITGTPNASPTCTVTVSAGAATATVPNVVGDTSAVAQAAIIAAGFPVGAVNSTTSTSAQIGLVLSQSPTPQAGVLLTQPVSFVVGAGPVTPNPPVLELPSLVGMTQAQAQATLAALGAGIGTVTAGYTSV
jgi:beta-lactam-binding protein with PASTA domain